MIPYYTDTLTPAQHEERARAWAEYTAGHDVKTQRRRAAVIAKYAGIPYRRVLAWVKWAERSEG